ncbi:hypothetical protein [Microbacterium maritypicum]|uniref:Uncharacterized protein n=1 Tax=Microbacterium maritypicum TaxID=33918 RepID=A0ACD4B557_MICMQ|nr:hypothetical protein [Microbacterium liquefaciens]UTT52701.1 hypothetical protein NMQ05_16710 [Microbacterium liquefaciens]
MMTDIYMDRDGMELRLKEVVASVDESDTKLGEFPSTPDAGIATSIIALMASAGAEAAGVANDATRALSAVTHDVLNDLTLSNEEIADEIRDIEEELDKS